MKNTKMIRVICNILIGVLFPCFFVALLWYINGSLEMFPTAEQEETARIAAGLLMLITGITAFICLIVRIKCRKQ